MVETKDTFLKLIERLPSGLRSTQTAMAKDLGLPKSTFFDKLKKYNINMSDYIAAKKKVKKRKQCEFEGCAKTSQQGGRCKTHGAKRKQCEFGDCTKCSYQHGLCQQHGELLTEEQKRKIAIETAEREKKRKSTAVTSKKETADRKAKETADRKAKGVERKRKRKENREVRLSSSSSSSWM